MNVIDRAKDIFFKYKKEIIMTSFFLFIAIISILFINLTRHEGQFVTVSVRGGETVEYSLSENGEYTLLNGQVILVIENGEAYIEYADCPDRVCVRTGRISRVGESIICLPNKLSITVTGEKSEDDPDIIT